MWFVFLVSCIVVALATLIIIWIGSKIIFAIMRQKRILDTEEEVYDKVKEKIKENLEDKEAEARLKHGWVTVEGADAVIADTK